MFEAVDPTPLPLATFRFLDLPLELQRHIISLLYYSYPVTVFVGSTVGVCYLDKSFPPELLLVNRYFHEQFKPVAKKSYARRLEYELQDPEFDVNSDIIHILERQPSFRSFFSSYAHRIVRIDNAPGCRNLKAWTSKFPSLRYINFADLIFTRKFNTFGGSVGWYHMKVNIFIFERSLAEILEGRCDSSYSDYVIGKFRRYHLVSVTKAYTSKELADIQEWFKNVAKRTTITLTHVMELSGSDSPWAEQYKKFRLPGDLLAFHFKISEDGERAIITRKEFRRSDKYVPNALNPRLPQAGSIRYGTDSNGHKIRNEQTKFRDTFFIGKSTPFNMPAKFAWDVKSPEKEWTPESFKLNI